MKKDGSKLYVDEKATLHYINRNIPTFAFEIKNDTSGAEGWLFNNNYITNYYLLAYPNAKDETVPSVSSFTQAEIITIKKASVKQLLMDYSLTKPKILELITRYREELAITNRFSITPDITLNFNTFLAERPINLVIKKDLLKNYAQYHTVIY